jgi:hypothetical protein
MKKICPQNAGLVLIMILVIALATARYLNSIIVDVDKKPTGGEAAGQKEDDRMRKYREVKNPMPTVTHNGNTYKLRSRKIVPGRYPSVSNNSVRKEDSLWRCKR